MKYKCICIDDEPFALKQMEEYIRKTPFLELTGSCLSADEALILINETEVDILFVDINMPGLNGMEFVKSLSDKYSIVFTTAYAEYAVESYKVDADDYILKPISYAEFIRSANKLKSKLETQTSSEDIVQTHFFVKADGKHVRIDYDNLHYIESLSEYVKIHLVSGETIVTLMRLKNLNAALPDTIFMRIHRSTIINLNHIKAIEKGRVLLSGNVYVPIGEQYKSVLKTFLEKRFL